MTRQGKIITREAEEEAGLVKDPWDIDHQKLRILVK